MKKITITIPFNDGRWKVRYGNTGAPSNRKSAELIYRWCERRILSLAGKEKTAISSKDGQMEINESCDSKNPNYLLWYCASFLEDYLNPHFLKSKLKLHEGSEV